MSNLMPFVSLAYVFLFSQLASAGPISNRALSYSSQLTTTSPTERKFVIGDFSCAKETQKNQDEVSPGWDYKRVAPNKLKQPIEYAWDPALHEIKGCTGLPDGWRKEISVHVVLDKSWLSYYQTNYLNFFVQGYNSLVRSPFLTMDRIDYIFRKQFGLSIKVSKVDVLPRLRDSCTPTFHGIRNVSSWSDTMLQMRLANKHREKSAAFVLRLGAGSANPGGLCIGGNAHLDAVCHSHTLANAMYKPFDDDGRIDYLQTRTVAHEIAHVLGICADKANCFHGHSPLGIPDIMGSGGQPVRADLTNGGMRKFLSECTPVYKDILCDRVRRASCAVDVPPPTISGNYFNAKYRGRANDWHYVTVREVVRGKVFEWKNRAGVSWALTRSETNAKKFMVGRSCPYYNIYKTTTVEMKKVNGENVVISIVGPHNEVYTRT